MLGRVYEYFLAQFASAEGKKGGQFYTPRASSACWSRCSRPTRAASTTPAAARAACSCRARSSSRRTAASIGDISHLRPGVEPHHLAAGQDEPRHPRHRRPDRPRRHLPQRPAPRPQGRLRPRQPAVQRQRLGRRAAARTTSAGSTACRRRATPTSPGSSTSSTTSRPTGIAGFVLANGSMSSNQSGEGEIRKAHHRGRPRRLHGRAAGPALLLDADPGLPLVPRARQDGTAASATGAARRCSSTPASWARWSTASTAS